MALSTGEMLGLGAVAGFLGFLFWRKSKSQTASSNPTPAAPGTLAASSVPRTLAPSNPYSSSSWRGAGYDLGYADAAKARTLGLAQDTSPEPPDVAYRQATDPYELEAGYIEGYNFYWKSVEV